MAMTNWQKFLLMFKTNKKDLLVILRYHKQEQKKKRYKGPLLPEISTAAEAEDQTTKAIQKMKAHGKCKQN